MTSAPGLRFVVSEGVSRATITATDAAAAAAVYAAAVGGRVSRIEGRAGYFALSVAQAGGRGYLTGIIRVIREDPAESGELSVT